jgi:hypothetical protein
MKARLLAACLILGLAAHAPAAAQVAAQTTPENSGPNTNIVRWAEGKFAYRSLKEQRERGWERYRLTVHPDGSRTMLMWHDVFARNSQFTVMLRADAAFRPIQAFISYWTAAGYKGAAMIDVEGDTLTARSAGPAGRATQTTAVPARFSLGSHPVSADGWHMAAEDPKAKGRQTGTVYSMEASTDMTKPVLGELRPQEFEIVGPETVTVPAGRFEATHYKVSGTVDVWIMGPDRLMVRMVNAPRDLDYVLAEFAAGDNTLRRRP